MSGAEEREPGGAAAAASSSSSVSSAAAAPSAAGLGGEAAGGAEEPRPLPLAEAGVDPDAPPKKRLKAAGGGGGAEGAAGSVKLEERLYSVLCCTVCLDLPKASVYQVPPPPSLFVGGQHAAPCTPPPGLGLGAARLLRRRTGCVPPGKMEGWEEEGKPPPRPPLPPPPCLPPPRPPAPTTPGAGPAT